MQIGRHLQKISRLESESHSGGVCLSSDIKEPEGFTPDWQGSDSLSDPSSETGWAWAGDELLPQLGEAGLCSWDLTAGGVRDISTSLPQVGLF